MKLAGVQSADINQVSTAGLPADAGSHLAATGSAKQFQIEGTILCRSACAAARACQSRWRASRSSFRPPVVYLRCAHL